MTTAEVIVGLKWVAGVFFFAVAYWGLVWFVGRFMEEGRGR